MRIPVCFAADAAYARPLAVAMASVLYSRGEDDELAFFVVDGGILDADKAILLEMVQKDGASLTFLPLEPDAFSDAPIQTVEGEVSHISAAAYYRLLLPSLLPEESRILYLDCDLVCRASLAPLFSVDMEGDWVRGVQDIDAARHCRRLGLSRYVCSGVLLLDLAAWRKCGVERRCLAFLHDSPERIILHDQDVINVVCQEHLGCLDRTWNAQACATRQGRMSGFNELGKTAAVVHFIGSRKPWQAGCTHPFRSEYFRVLRLTPYRRSVWAWRLECLRWALWHSKHSHGRRRWYFCGVRIWQTGGISARG
jgi:lipopolysaccharide biosynthesis glycosyltransferase